MDLRFGPVSPQGFAGEIDAVGVVDEAVEDGVGIGGVADKAMPVGDRDLAGDESGFAPVAVFEDFQKVMAALGRQGFETPVVEDEQIDGGEAL